MARNYGSRRLPLPPEITPIENTPLTMENSQKIPLPGKYPCEKNTEYTTRKTPPPVENVAFQI